MSDKRLTEREKQMYRHDEFSQEVFQVKVDGLDFSRTSEEGFKANDRMKDLGQLRHDGDSLRAVCDSVMGLVHNDAKTFTFVKAKRIMPSDSAIALSIDTAGVVVLSDVGKEATPARLHQSVQSALRQARTNKQYVDEKKAQYEVEYHKVVRHNMEVHKKFTLPVACLLFFFIGAPLGAIIRKGGLGTPIVISVLFFIFYYIIDTFGSKTAREHVWPVPIGMWLSTFILASIGSFLTYKSATDSSLFRSEAYGRVAEKIKEFIRKKRKRGDGTEPGEADSVGQ